MKDYDRFLKDMAKEDTKYIPLPTSSLKVGSRDKQGNLLVAGGREVDILRTPIGKYIVGTNIFLEEKDAIESYNALNNTRLKADHISRYFQPWFEKMILRSNKDRLIVKVPSRTTKGVDYDVCYDINGNIVCDPKCVGFLRRGKCWHTEAVTEMMEDGGLY